MSLQDLRREAPASLEARFIADPSTFSKKTLFFLRKAHFSATSSQRGYSENSKTVSRSFTWLTLASPRSSHLGLAQKVVFPQAKQHCVRECAAVCNETRLQRSWSRSTRSIFFRSHLAEILETQRVRSWRLKEWDPRNIPRNTPHNIPHNSVFFPSHLAEILETPRVRSWRLKE